MVIRIMYEHFNNIIINMNPSPTLIFLLYSINTIMIHGGGGTYVTCYDACL